MHTYTATNTHTHTPLTHTTKHGALLARIAEDGADLTFHKKHTTLTNIHFTQKPKFIRGVHNSRLLTHNPTVNKVTSDTNLFCSVLSLLNC
jgi:hypothetical protein